MKATSATSNCHRLLWPLFVFLLLAHLLAGCGPKESASNEVIVPLPSDPFDVTQLNRDFESASPGVKVYLAETVSLARGGNNREALEQLQKLLANPSLTGEQKAALQDFMAKVKALPNSRQR